MWYLAWYYFDTKKLNKAKEYGDLREKIWIFPQNTKQICLVLEKLCRVGMIPSGLSINWKLSFEWSITRFGFAP